jgi:hypothetical protein
MYTDQRQNAVIVSTCGACHLYAVNYVDTWVITRLTMCHWALNKENSKQWQLLTIKECVARHFAENFV